MADFQQAVDSGQTSELRLIAMRLDTIASDVTELKIDIRQQLTDHEQRLRALESRTERLDARVNTFGMLQAAYATVVSVIAGFVGAQR